MKRTKTSPGELPNFLDLAAVIQGTSSPDHRGRVSDLTAGDVARHAPITVFEELTAVLFLGALSWWWTLLKFLCFCLLLVLLPLYRPWPPLGPGTFVCNCIMKYFSFRVAYEETLSPKQHRYILVAPPHGVFPIGNLLTMQGSSLIIPDFHLCGLAASMVFFTPLFRHFMAAVGCIDASRDVALKALQSGKSIGISSGGVAEIFENTDDVETVVLRERQGFIRLACLTGAQVVPCYLFGNTKTLSCVMHPWIRALSRRVGFGTTLFWGRFGLPIPRRVPIFGVMGAPIAVPRYERYQDIPHAEVQRIHEEFMAKMQELFDKFKGLYGWEGKHLVIKLSHWGVFFPPASKMILLTPACAACEY
eukprot:g70968.t1